MRDRSKSPLAVAIGLAWVAASLGAGPADEVRGRWVGQDGRDRVGRSTEPGPNGVQDIVIRLGGLPRAAIETLTVEGEGGDKWVYQGAYGPWAADVVRAPGRPEAEVFLEPSRIEDGRSFHVMITFDRGPNADFYLRGGRADPAIRTAAAKIEARWLGPANRDEVGPGPAVGPDGVEDVAIALFGLLAGAGVDAIDVRSSGDVRWAFGNNPEGARNAEFFRDDDRPDRGVLLLAHAPEMEGGRVRLDISYDDGTRDATELAVDRAGRLGRATTPEPPSIEDRPLRVSWLGQSDGGKVRVRVDGLPPTPLAGAELSGPAGSRWTGGPPREPFADGRGRAEPMEVDAGRGRCLLTFTPDRDLEGGSLSLRLAFADGSNAIVAFEGQSCDPERRFERSGGTFTTLGAGDDLVRRLGRGGSFRLARGTHRLDRPLVLLGPTTIVGEPGAVLSFRQPSDAREWPEAIRIEGGATRLEGFAVRFEGPVRWDRSASWGPAIVGIPARDEERRMPVHATVRGLDVEGPTASGDWEQAPHCLRLNGAEGGRIADCRFRGGAIELRGGPWTIEGNEHRGAMPGTFAYSVISAHSVRDLRVLGNEVRPSAGSGKLWRFLVLTGRGDDVLIRDNRVADVGPMDDDEHPHPNAPEIILTESYRIRFEGRPLGRAHGGRLLTIPEPQGGAVGAGDWVSVLSGPSAGTSIRVRHVIDGRHLWLEGPLPDGRYEVSVGPGFAGMVVEGNEIDARGSTQSACVVLAGNHFGTRVIDNVLMGGKHGFEISAYPTESPRRWGWTHAPAFNLEIARNEIVDPSRGSLIAVIRDGQTKSSSGRVYLTARVLDNRFRWSGPPEQENERVALTVGQGRCLDPGELVLTTSGNTATVEGGTPPGRPLRIVAGTVNGSRSPEDGAGRGSR